MPKNEKTPVEAMEECRLYLFWTHRAVQYSLEVGTMSVSSQDNIKTVVWKIVEITLSSIGLLNILPNYSNCNISGHNIHIAEATVHSHCSFLFFAD